MTTYNLRCYEDGGEEEVQASSMAEACGLWTKWMEHRDWQDPDRTILASGVAEEITDEGDVVASESMTHTCHPPVPECPVGAGLALDWLAPQRERRGDMRDTAERAQYNAIMRGGRDMRDMAAEQAQYDAIRWSDRLQMTGAEMEEELQIAREQLEYAREEGDPHYIRECRDNVAVIAAELAVA